MTVDCEYQLVQLITPRSEGRYNYNIYLSKAFQKFLLDLETNLNMAQDRITRKWEVFAGRNRFYCDGRLMTAPHSSVFLLTVCLITGTSTLFFIFE